MATVLTFAGNLVDDPQLDYTRDNKPFLTFRVLVKRRVRGEDGEWADAEPTGHNVRVYGSAATHGADSFGRGDRVLVHGVLKTDAWADASTGEKKTRDIVEVSERFGELGASLRWAAARLERHPAPRAVS